MGRRVANQQKIMLFYMRITSAVKKSTAVSDSMAYTVLTGHWYTTAL
jgi:hypothetical protein